MLLVPYTLRPGPHGLGVFNDKFLLRGQAVYRRLPGFALRLAEADVALLHPAVRAKVEAYAYPGKGPHRQEGLLYYDADDSRFLNHSATPNLVPVGDGEEYRAVRDIAAGEELTCDYRDFAEEGDAFLRFLEPASSPVVT